MKDVLVTSFGHLAQATTLRAESGHSLQVQSQTSIQEEADLQHKTHIHCAANVCKEPLLPWSLSHMFAGTTFRRDASGPQPTFVLIAANNWATSL